MATLFVRHGVSDFARWKQAYDDFDAERKTMGVTGDGVYQADGNPNNVTAYHDFDTMEAAKAFAENPRLKKVMDAGGVVGEPTIWFTNKV
jgi:hypothetical protein